METSTSSKHGYIVSIHDYAAIGKYELRPAPIKVVVIIIIPKLGSDISIA